MNKIDPDSELLSALLFDLASNAWQILFNPQPYQCRVEIESRIES
jgi:hypothetical protein